MPKSTSRTELEGLSRYSISEADSGTIEPQRYLPFEADCGMSWELPTKEIDQAPWAPPVDISSEKYVPEPALTLESDVSTINPSSPFAPSRTPTSCRSVLQSPISTMDYSLSDPHCPRLVSESEELSDKTTNEGIKTIRIDEDYSAQVRYLSDHVGQGSASEKVFEDPSITPWESIILAGRDGFCESPTSISNGTEFITVALNINPSDVDEGAITQSSVITSQASRTFGSHIPESSVDVFHHGKSCSGISERQSPDLPFSSPSNRKSLPYKSSNRDTHASTHDHVSPQGFTPPQASSSSELLGILNSQSGRLEGLMPAGLLARMGDVFQLTTERSLQKLDRLNEPEVRAAVDPVYRIQPTLDTGLSALKSLIIGQVPNELSEVLSLLFVAYSIVAMLVDEQNQAQFTEALFLDDIEWIDAMVSHEEQNTLELLLRFVWLPTGIGPVCTHGHRTSSQGWRSSRPTTSLFKPSSLPLEDGLLDGETESGFRLRTGLHARICQWFIEYFHRAGSLHNRIEPYSPESYKVRAPPSFEESVREDLLSPWMGLSSWMDHPISDARNQMLDTLQHELDSGRISTFDDIAALLNSPMNISASWQAFDPTVFFALCRGAQAMYKSRKAGWVLNQLRRAANIRVLPGEVGYAEAPRPLLADTTDTLRLHDLDRLPHVQLQPSGEGNISTTTSPATSPTRKRKRRRWRTDSRESAFDGEASQITQCPHCKQTFTGTAGDQKSNLNRHIEHKHPHARQGSGNVCLECGELFFRSDYFLNHMRGAHNLW